MLQRYNERMYVHVYKLSLWTVRLVEVICDRRTYWRDSILGISWTDWL